MCSVEETKVVEKALVAGEGQLCWQVFGEECRAIALWQMEMKESRAIEIDN